MGASSTRYITRKDALKVLIPKLMTVSNEELEEILDKVWERSLYNFSITYDYPDRPECEKDPDDPWAPDSYEQEIYDMTYGIKRLD